MAEAQQVSSIQLTLSQDEADQLLAVVTLVKDPYLVSTWDALERVTIQGAYEAYTDHNAVRMEKGQA